MQTGRGLRKHGLAILSGPRPIAEILERFPDRVEAWLTEEGSRTRLVVEERGLPLERLYFHGAGWQAHLEDLRRSLEGEAAAGPEPWTEQSPEPGWRARWAELTPAYEQMVID